MSSPHFCPARLCAQQVGRMVACPAHWKLLPVALRTEIGRAEQNLAGTPAHAALVLEAVELLRDGHSKRWGARSDTAWSIIGVHEIVEMAGVKRASAVWNWRDRYEDFPAPILVLGCGPLFHRGDVAAWLDRHKRWRKTGVI